MTTSWNGQSVSPFYEVYQKQKGAIDKAVTEAAKSSAAERGKQFFDVYAHSVSHNHGGPMPHEHDKTKGDTRNDPPAHAVYATRMLIMAATLQLLDVAQRTVRATTDPVLAVSLATFRNPGQTQGYRPGIAFLVAIEVGTRPDGRLPAYCIRIPGNTEYGPVYNSRSAAIQQAVALFRDASSGPAEL